MLERLHWPGVLNLKVRNLLSRYTLLSWRVRALIAAGWEIDAHTITHPDLTHVSDAQLWNEVHGSKSRSSGASTFRWSSSAIPRVVTTHASLRP